MCKPLHLVQGTTSNARQAKEDAADANVRLRTHRTILKAKAALSCALPDPAALTGWGVGETPSSSDVNTGVRRGQLAGHRR